MHGAESIIDLTWHITHEDERCPRA